MWKWCNKLKWGPDINRPWIFYWNDSHGGHLSKLVIYNFLEDLLNEWLLINEKRIFIVFIYADFKNKETETIIKRS